MESGALTWNAIQSEPVQVVSRAVRALLELPDTIVAEILRLVDTGRYLEDREPPFQPGFAAVYGKWAGTRRMVNRQYLLLRYKSSTMVQDLILGRWSGGSYGQGRWIHDRYTKSHSRFDDHTDVTPTAL